MAELIRIAINGRFLDRRTTGVGRFARETLLALDAVMLANAEYVHGMRFELLVPRHVVPDIELRAITVRHVGRLKGQLWEQFELPFHVRGHLLLNLCNAAPALLRKQIVVIHDAMVIRHPEALSWRFRLWYRLLLPWLGRRVRHVVTVSDFSRREIAACYGIPASRSTRVYEGSEHLLRVKPDVTTISRFELETRPFVLCVSSQIRYKNLVLLAKAMGLLSAPQFTLVVAGGCNDKVFKGLDAKSLKSIQLLGYVSDAELCALFRQSLCFVFPSRYEGFGLPVVEAMALGCPVACSDAASLPEICGSAALMFDPEDAESLATALQRFTEVPSLREEFKQLGLRRSGELTWASTAREIVNLCRRFS